jgi:hypothetical protein
MKRSPKVMRKISIFAVLATAALVSQAAAAWATVCGSADFSRAINWPTSSALTYSVSGAPANTCGNLWTDRNGSGFTLESVGWICTDNTGAATKGPWSSNPSDETAYVYIDWGSCVSPTREHIWDVTAPTVSIGQVSPGSTFSGTASDGSWGAGFSSSWFSNCLVTYYDSTDGLYWVPSTNLYADTSPYVIGSTLTGMPSLNIAWSANSVATVQSGHCYDWRVQCWDGGQWGYARTTFCQ